MSQRRGMRAPVKAKDFKSSIKKLLIYIKKYYLPIGISIIFTIIAAILAIIGPSQLSKIATDASHIFYNENNQKFGGVLIQNGFYVQDLKPFMETSKILKHIRQSGIILLSFYGLSFILNYLQSFILAGVNQKITNKFRRDISKKINNVPLAYFDHCSYGDVLSRVTNDVDTIGQSLNQSITSLVSAITMLVGVIIAMMVTCYQLGLTTLATVPVTMILIMVIVKFSQKYYKNQQIYLGKLNGIIEESYSGAIVVKSFNIEDKVISEFEKSNDMIAKNAFMANVYSGLMMPITSFVTNLGYVAICVVGGYLFKTGKIEIGVLTSFIVYLNLFRSPLQQIAQAMNFLQSMAASAERVFEFLELEEQEDESYKTKKLEHVSGKVTFENVNFSYYIDKPIIKNFSCVVNKGDKVAIVGPTGAGKTTIVNLLMRFYEINSGRILIDDVDTKEMKREDVRKLFSMVLQDTWIFNGTIRDNIIYDKKDVTEEQLKNACIASNLEHFINSSPNGLDTVLNETTALSEGQKQLITIARAMVLNSPMLILDEATSNIDTRTEILIQKAMDNLTEGRTSFVIAHRLSTIKNADLILVLDNGNIVEQGNHESLLKLNGVYAKLYNSQFEEIDQ